MKRLLSVALCVLMVAGAAFAAPKGKKATTAKVNDAAFVKEYQAMMDSLQVVGSNVVVVKDNKIIYSHCFGLKNMETGEKMAPNTIVRIASISKSFTATAIMQLAEQGKLKITDEVSKYLPFKIQNPQFPETPITLEMLMRHTSSLNDSQGYWTSYDPLKADDSYKCYNYYKPGVGYEYCNFGFNILAGVIEKVTGQRFYQYIQNNIMKPLGIQGSYSVDDLDRSRFATLYAWEGGKFVEQPEAYSRPDVLDNYQLCVSTPRISAAGGVKVTAMELAKYMLMHMNYGKSPLSTTRIISAKSSKEMQTPVAMTEPVYIDKQEIEDSGLGLARISSYVPGVELVGHTGGAYGMRSAMFFDPVKKFGFVVITNGARSGKVLGQSLQIMYKNFIGKIPGKKK